MVVVGIAGGTSSGKTTLASVIKQTFRDKTVIIPQDMYYHDCSQLSPDERTSVNFDHPNAFNFHPFALCSNSNY